jgi:cyclophilin family peptidyl-prolyl cis-trans isomerase
MQSWRATLAAGLVTSSWLAALPAAAQTLPELMPGCEATIENDPDRVLVDTPLGTLTLQLFPSVAPQTVANFLGYIERGDYTDTLVHRVVPGAPGPQDDFVIQAGGFAQSGIRFQQIESQSPVPNEPCISNQIGTIAMAKTPDDPDSATSQWFVNLNDNSANLDNQNGGFTAFGRVLGNGLELATAIANLEERAPSSPLPPYLADVLGTAWNSLTGYPDYEAASGSPLLTPLVDPGIHGCFEVAQSGVVLTESPESVDDLQPGTVESNLPYALVSLACAGAGAGGTPGFACSPPGRRILRVDPDTFLYIPESGAPLGYAEITLSCEELAASEASFTTRLENLGSQFDAKLVKTSYTVPEPGPGIAAAASLLSLSLLARTSRNRRR